MQCPGVSGLCTPCLGSQSPAALSATLHVDGDSGDTASCSSLTGERQVLSTAARGPAGPGTSLEDFLNDQGNVV